MRKIVVHSFQLFKPPNKNTNCSLFPKIIVSLYKCKIQECIINQIKSKMMSHNNNYNFFTYPLCCGCFFFFYIISLSCWCECFLPPFIMSGDASTSIDILSILFRFERIRLSSVTHFKVSSIESVEKNQLSPFCCFNSNQTPCGFELYVVNPGTT